MSIPRIIVRSLREGFLTKKILPLFALYFSFMLILLTLMNPVLKNLPELLTLETTKSSVVAIGTAFVAVLAIFLIVLLVNIWFVGGLTYQAYSNKPFKLCLKKSQQAYWRILVLTFVMIFINLITSQFSIVGNIIRIIADLILFFALPMIIIKNYSLSLSVKKSFNLFSKNILRTVIFWFSMFLILILIVLALSFSIAATLTPVLIDSLSSISSFDATSSDKQVLTQVVGVILENYPFLYFLSIVASYFISGAYTFYTFARAYFYLELLKNKSNQ